MTNEAIRRALFERNMAQWKLADLLGISEFTLCRRLRKELPQEEQEKIVALIMEDKSNE